MRTVSQQGEDERRDHAGYLRTSAEWVDYFKRNGQALMVPPWEHEHRLSRRERRAVARSIAIFQLGEGSDGQHFIRCARDYAQDEMDPHYVDALRAFINEEQRHSQTLARFMEREEIPALQKQWTDVVFRKLRHLAGLELCISVLVTAELVAKVYYRALHDATMSPVLKTICRQILRDEEQHIHFQAGTLAKLTRHRSLWKLGAAELLRKFFMVGTLVVVWHDHHRVLRAGGFSLRRFCNRTWDELEDMNQVIRECVILKWRTERLFEEPHVFNKSIEGFGHRKKELGHAS